MSLRPITGRKHQLRIHTSHHGLPLLGDSRYGGPTRLVTDDGTVISVRRIMLHSYRLDIPWECRQWSVACAVPADFTELWMRLGGRAECLQPSR